VGGRADRSSANGETGRFYLFPKASASYRVTGLQLPFGSASRIVDEIKFRLAYGETGNRPFYSDKFTPLLQSTVGGQTAYRTATTLNDPGLRPERQRELEGGIDASFLGNALSLEATAYRRNVSDLLLNGTPPPSTGYTSTFANLGGLRVHGYEAAVSAFPVRRSRFTWTSRVSFGMNRSRVTEMRGDSIIVFGSRLTDGQVWLREGHSATEITGIDSVPVPGTLVRVGDGAPKWTGGWSNEFRWRGLSLYALLDHQEGSRLWAGTLAIYDGSRNSPDWDVLLPDGRTVGAVRSAAVGKVTRIRNQDATYTKLRELTVGWDLPAGLRERMGGARSARLLLSGRNLRWWTKFRGGDPEAENFFGGFALPQVQRNRELAAYPASRVYWLTVHLEY
jgi:outer membrane receptor protein involved in Fe transport